MRGNITASIVGAAIAMTLAACAAKGPVGSAGRPSTGISADDALAAEYQSLIANAMGQTVCEDGSITGSRIIRREVCRTRAQRDADHQQALDILEVIEKGTVGMPAATAEPASNGPGTP